MRPIYANLLTFQRHLASQVCGYVGGDGNDEDRRDNFTLRIFLDWRMAVLYERRGYSIDKKAGDGCDIRLDDSKRDISRPILARPHTEWPTYRLRFGGELPSAWRW